MGNPAVVEVFRPFAISRHLPWVVLAVTLGWGWWWKAQCLAQEQWGEGVQYRRFCYSDVMALWFTRGWSEGATPYLDNALEYPALIGVQLAVLVRLTHALGGGLVTYFHLNVLVAAVLAVCVLALLAATRLPRRRLLMWAAAPTLGLYAFHNWDLLAVTLLTGAVVLHLRGRPGWAGVAVGLGAAAKLFPLVLLPLILLDRWRTDDRRGAGRHLGGALTAWLAVNLPLALTSWDQWTRFFVFSESRSATAATVWTVLEWSGLLDPDPLLLNRLQLVTTLIGGALILVLGARRLPPGQLWRLGLPLLAWLLAASKVFSPQFALWLVPLFALSGPLGGFLAFQATDVAVFFAELAFLGGRAGVWPSAAYWPLAMATLFRLAVLGWVVWETTLHPGPHSHESNQRRLSRTSGWLSTP